jgi:predicted acyl esterase
MWISAFLLAVVTATAFASQVALPGDITNIGWRTWTKYVKMRDGVELHTRMLVPRDYEEGKKYTVIMDRSPYGQFGIELLADLFVPAGFISVCQGAQSTHKFANI